LNLKGFEEIMMIINHVIGGQNIIRFVIRFDYAYLGKVASVASLSGLAMLASQAVT
jgi:hypothetical protein